MLRRLLPFTLFLLFPLLAGADVLVSPARVGSPGADRYYPKAAPNGDGYLVVWLDYRDGRSEHRAIRVDRDGVPIDRTDFSLGAYHPAGDEVHLASDGRDTLVVFSRFPVSTSLFVTSDGRVLPGPSFDGAVHDVTFAGDRYVVAMRYGVLRLLDRRGDVVRSRIVISRREEVRHTRLAGSPGGRLLVLWQTLGGPFTNVVDVDYLAAPGFAGFDSGSSAAPAVQLLGAAASGDSFLAVWREGFGRNYYTRVRALDRGGRVLGPDRTIHSAPFSGYGAVASDGNSFYVTADDFTPNRKLIRLAADGRLLATMPVAVAGELADGDGFVLSVWAYLNGGMGGSHVWAAAVDGGGDLVRAPSLVARNLLRQQYPDAARCGEGWLTAWTELGQYAEVRYRRFALDGLPLDRESIVLASGPKSDHAHPAVACGGGTAFIAWVESQPAENSTSLTGRLHAAILGIAPEPLRIVLDDNTGVRDQQLDVVWDGDSWVVAWTDGGELRVSRWDRHGRPVGSGSRTVRTYGWEAAAIGFNGSEFLVVHYHLSRADEIRLEAFRLDRDLRRVTTATPVNALRKHVAFGSVSVTGTPSTWTITWTERTIDPVRTSHGPWTHVAVTFPHDALPFTTAAPAAVDPRLAVAHDAVVAEGLILYTRVDPYSNSERLWMRLEEPAP